MGLGRAKGIEREHSAETQLAQPRGATWAGGDGHGLALLPQPHRARARNFDRIAGARSAGSVRTLAYAFQATEMACEVATGTAQVRAPG